MSCGWDVKWLAFTTERHGAIYHNKRLGIDKEMKVLTVLHPNTYNVEQLPVTNWDQ
jgi:hypothetical protein